MKRGLQQWPARRRARLVEEMKAIPLQAGSTDSLGVTPDSSLFDAASWAVWQVWCARELWPPRGEVESRETWQPGTHPCHGARFPSVESVVGARLGCCGVSRQNLRDLSTPACLLGRQMRARRVCRRHLHDATWTGGQVGWEEMEVESGKDKNSRSWCVRALLCACVPCVPCVPALRAYP